MLSSRLPHYSATKKNSRVYIPKGLNLERKQS